MDRINIFGASGHAKVIINILQLNNCKIATLYDDKAPYQLLGFDVEKLTNYTTKTPFIIAIGDNKIRKKIATTLLTKNSFSKAIHPSAIIDDTTIIEHGTVIMANAIVNSSSKIGKHCIINTGAIIEHDSIINDYVHISPRATLCGNVHIGEGTQIGAGAVILPNINIGKWAIIGAGSVVIKDIPDNVTVVGNPARIINK